MCRRRGHRRVADCSRAVAKGYLGPWQASLVCVRVLFARAPRGLPSQNGLWNGGTNASRAGRVEFSLSATGRRHDAIVTSEGLT